jgi:thiamine-phosphate pyrophosphorylase
MRDNSSLFRTIDANLNRYKEGIRVVEDILRYEYDSNIAHKLKNLRHIEIPDYEKFVRYRNASKDVLKKSTQSEQKRTSIKDLIIANLKRSQESARVLEEIFKIFDIITSEKFKNARYELYDLEKEILSLLGT